MATNQWGFAPAEWASLGRYGKNTVVYQSKIPEFNRRLDKAVNKLLANIGTTVAGDATLIAPIDTGNLANSIDYRTDERASSVSVGTPVEYGIYQELGTSRHRAQPYIVPAFQQTMPKLEEMARKEFAAIEGPAILSIGRTDNNP